MATDMTVSTTILEQLGGRRFIVMTGAKDFVGSDDALTFGLPVRSTKNKCNKVRITLTPDDLYEVEFMNISLRRSGDPVKVLSTHKGIYNDNLRELFTRETGLYTSLRG